MNPESLLHKVAQMLRVEAELGPGTMFIVGDKDNVDVTRTPKPDQELLIIAKYDCQQFCKGLTAPQYAALLKKLWDACKPEQKGGTSEQQQSAAAGGSGP